MGGTLEDHRGDEDHRDSNRRQRCAAEPRGADAAIPGRDLPGAQLLEREQEIASGLEPIPGPFLEAASHEVFEQGWHLRVDSREAGRFLLEDACLDLGRRGARERMLPGNHLIEHHTQREDVGAMVRRFALELLGRHVSGRAHGDAGLGLQALGRR